MSVCGQGRPKQSETSAQILLIDIETAPLLVNVWRLWDEHVGLEQLRKDRHLLSFAAKWLGTREVIYADQSRSKHIEDDRKLLKQIWDLFDAADIVVAHNGQAFDIPMIQGRMLLQGMPPPSPFTQVDTLLIARKHFALTSNKLEYLSERLGCPKLKHKVFPGFELWKETLAGNPRAWSEMRKYNIQDVLALEKVYLKLRPWMVGHPNLGMYVNSVEPVCPRCGGPVQERGTRTTNFGRYRRYRCNLCRGWSRGRTLMNTREHRRLQLAN